MNECALNEARINFVPLTIVMAGSSYFFDMVVSLGFELRVLSLELTLGLELSFVL